MKNRLAAGRVIAIAPRYKSASARLSLAEATAQHLVATLGAQPVSGTLAAMRELLETPPEEPVGLLFFTGHGVFSADAPAGSAIKLEDGTLAVDTRLRDALRALRGEDGAFVLPDGAQRLAFPRPGPEDDAAYAAEASVLVEIDGIVRAEQRVRALEGRLDALEQGPFRRGRRLARR